MQSINNLNKIKFVHTFSNIFENTKWIAEETYKFIPFKDFNDLEKKMINIFNNSGEDNQLKIILNHPDLADKLKVSKLTYESKNEQKNAQLENCTEEEYNEFKKLNFTYKKKFGFPFILSVANKNKKEILECFKRRINHDSKNEFNEALIQVKKIASSRLSNIRNNI